MDGNRRWAKAQGLPSFAGHQAGYQKVKEVAKWCQEEGVNILTLFAFSTENWKRSKEEVAWIMKLFVQLFSKDIKEIHENNICLKVLGRRDGLSKKLQELIIKSEALTKNNTGSFLNLCINYGGRQELIEAFGRIIKSRQKQITEELISKNLYSAGLPDPDLIIRTSGEVRTSGFLLWQGAYAELLFIKNNWPAFSRRDFNQALREFARRQRRFGQ